MVTQECRPPSVLPGLVGVPIWGFDGDERQRRPVGAVLLLVDRLWRPRGGMPVAGEHHRVDDADDDCPVRPLVGLEVELIDEGYGFTEAAVDAGRRRRPSPCSADRRSGRADDEDHGVRRPSRFSNGLAGRPGRPADDQLGHAPRNLLPRATARGSAQIADRFEGARLNDHDIAVRSDDDRFHPPLLSGDAAQAELDFRGTSDRPDGGLTAQRRGATTEYCTVALCRTRVCSTTRRDLADHVWVMDVAADGTLSEAGPS